MKQTQELIERDEIHYIPSRLFLSPFNTDNCGLIVSILTWMPLLMFNYILHAFVRVTLVRNNSGWVRFGYTIH